MTRTEVLEEWVAPIFVAVAVMMVLLVVVLLLAAQ
jgi:hypothetical protein